MTLASSPSSSSASSLSFIACADSSAFSCTSLPVPLDRTGSVGGTIAGATKLLAVADDKTKIVPGHGPLGTKADLTKYRDMLTTVHDRLQKLKSSGKSVDEAVAAKPIDDLNAAWGKGLFNSDAFVQIAYPAL